MRGRTADLPWPGIRRAMPVLVCIATLAAAACGQKGTPESQVRSAIAEGERAAEARDLSGLMKLVSPSYHDDRGNGREEFKQYLRGYLVMHQSVHLWVKVDSVAFPYRDMARVRLTLGTLGTGNSAAGPLGLAGDVYDVQLELQVDRGEWRVTRARWKPTSRA